METIYIDSLFLLNFTIDYLLLRLTARLCGEALTPASAEAFRYYGIDRVRVVRA